MPRNAPPLSASAQSIPTAIFAALAPHLEARRARGLPIVPLQIGDTYRRPPAEAHFEHNLVELESEPLYQYGATTGLSALKEEFGRFLLDSGKVRGRPPGASQILIAAGATHALFCAARSVLDAGEEVLVLSPYWPLSVGVFQSAGAIPVSVPWNTSGGSSSDISSVDSMDGVRLEKDLRAQLTPRTRAIYLATPNNPDGRILGRSELQGIARIAEEHNLWVFLDEVYADYLYDEGELEFDLLESLQERLLRVFSMSKSHGLAGARVGFLVAPERVVATANRVSTHSVYNVPVLSQRAALSALRNGETWLAESRKEYAAARLLVSTALASLPGSAAMPRAGAYYFLDLRIILAGRSLDKLLEAAIAEGVLLAPGRAFGPGYEGFARLCFTAVPRPQLADGLSALLRAIETFARG